MKHRLTLPIACAAILGVLAACGKTQKQYGEAIDPKARVISVDQIVKNPSAYEGQMVTVQGWMGDICADGEDFYFKGKFELAEIVPPEGQLPPSSLKGKSAKVYGTLWVKHEKAEKRKTKEQAHEEGEESEVKILAKGIRFD